MFKKCIFIFILSFPCLSHGMKNNEAFDFFYNDIEKFYNTLEESFLSGAEKALAVKKNDVIDLTQEETDDADIVKEGTMSDSSFDIENGFKELLFLHALLHRRVENVIEPRREQLESNKKENNIFEEKIEVCSFCEEKQWNTTIHKNFYCSEQRHNLGENTTEYNVVVGKKIYVERCVGCKQVLQNTPVARWKHRQTCEQLRSSGNILYLAYCKCCGYIFFDNKNFRSHTKKLDVCIKNQQDDVDLEGVNCPVENCNFGPVPYKKLRWHYITEHDESVLLKAFAARPMYYPKKTSKAKN